MWSPVQPIQRFVRWAIWPNAMANTEPLST